MGVRQEPGEAVFMSAYKQSKAENYAHRASAVCRVSPHTRHLTHASRRQGEHLSRSPLLPQRLTPYARSRCLLNQDHLCSLPRPLLSTLTSLQNSFPSLTVLGPPWPFLLILAPGGACVPALFTPPSLHGWPRLSFHHSGASLSFFLPSFLPSTSLPWILIFHVTIL